MSAEDLKTLSDFTLQNRVNAINLAISALNALKAPLLAEMGRRVAAAVQPVDVLLINHGSIVVLNALTVAAQEWFESHLPEDRQRWGRNGAVVEPRYVADIVEGLEVAGLVVAV